MLLEIKKYQSRHDIESDKTKEIFPGQRTAWSSTWIMKPDTNTLPGSSTYDGSQNNAAITAILLDESDEYKSGICIAWWNYLKIKQLYNTIVCRQLAPQLSICRWGRER